MSLPSLFKVSLPMPPEIVANNAVLPDGIGSGITVVFVAADAKDVVIVISAVFVMLVVGVISVEDLLETDEMASQAVPKINVIISNTASTSILFDKLVFIGSIKAYVC